MADTEARDTPPTPQRQATSATTSPKTAPRRHLEPRNTSRTLPFGIKPQRLAIRVQIYEVGDDAEYHPLADHLWSVSVLGDLFRLEYPELSEVVLIDGSTAIIFFGRRILDEGLRGDEADEIAIRLSHGWRNLVGRRIAMRATPVPVAQARRQAAKAFQLARQVEEAERQAADRAAERKRTARRGPSTWTEDDLSTDEELVGMGPQDIATDRLTEMDMSRPNTPVNTPKRRGRGRGRGNESDAGKPPGNRSSAKRQRIKKERPPPAMEAPTGRPRRAPRRRQPSPPATTDAGDTDSDASTVSSVSMRSGASTVDPLEAERRRNSKVTKLAFNNLDPDSTTQQYLMWRGAVTNHRRNGYPESVIASGIMNAITRLTGVLHVRDDTTLPEILTKLDKKFKLATNLDQRMRDMYNLEQGERESVSDFAARVSDMVQITHELFPDRWTKDEVDGMSRYRFFSGLDLDLRGPLAYLKSSLPKFTFDDLVDAVKEHESTFLKAQKKRKAETTYPRSDKYGDRRGNRYGSSSTQPRGRKAAASPPPDLAPDPDSAPESEDSGLDTDEEQTLGALVGLNLGNCAARIAKGVSQFEKSERLCYICDSPDHLYAQCPQRGSAHDPLRRLTLNGSGGQRKQGTLPPKSQKPKQKSGKPEKTQKAAASHPADKSN